MTIERLNALVDQWRSEGDSRGVVALKALDYCYADQQSPPKWVIKDIVDCWNHYQNGVPNSGWEGDVSDDVKRGDVPRTLGEAFGISDKGISAKKNAKLAWYGPKIRDYIKSNGLPFSDAGFEQAAKALKITPANARLWYNDWRKLRM